MRFWPCAAGTRLMLQFLGPPKSNSHAQLQAQQVAQGQHYEHCCSRRCFMRTQVTHVAVSCCVIDTVEVPLVPSSVLCEVFPWHRSDWCAARVRPQSTCTHAALLHSQLESANFVRHT